MVTKGDVELPVEFVGQTRGAVDVEVRARVEGILLGMHFQEGKEVKEGDLLYSIDPAPMEAKVAEANAKLAEAETRLVKAESDLKRIRPLAKMKAVSERDLDAAVAMQGVAAGAVEAAKASLESAKIELGYAKMYAPVSGMISLSKAKVGEFVGKMPNPVLLATISQLDPIHVRFGVSENEYLYFARLKQKQEAAGEKREPTKLVLELSDQSIHPETGLVVSVDSQIDPKTGSVMIEASFPNPSKVIRAGQFAKVKAIGEVLKGALTIPKAAVRDIQGVKQVSVLVNSDKPGVSQIEVRTIKVGREANDRLEVTEGLKEGEVIVPEVQQRLKNGTLVIPKQ